MSSLFIYYRESIYRLLPQTTAENISKNFEQYTIDPATRYPNLNSSCVRPHQVRPTPINTIITVCLPPVNPKLPVSGAASVH